MDKRKKTILIVIVAVICIIAIVAGLFILLKKEKIEKVSNYYEKLKSASSYNFIAVLNDENTTNYTREGNKAYIDSTYKGRNSKYIIKDGNTYLLKDNDKSYYTYTNNEIELYKIENQFYNIKDNDAVSGKENIDGTKYKYEEFKGYTSFYFNSIDEGVNEDNIKTRFYFDKENNLVYIKTIIDENTEQLVKIDYSENINKDVFEIPSDYEKMN